MKIMKIGKVKKLVEELKPQHNRIFLKFNIKFDCLNGKILV